MKIWDTIFFVNPTILVLAAAQLFSLNEILSDLIEQSDFTCEQEGFFPNENRCEKFYQCVWSSSSNSFQKYDYECEDNEFFDINLKRCKEAKMADTFWNCEYNSIFFDENNDKDWWDYSRAPGYETEDSCIYDLRIHYIYGSPDGVLKRMIGFNGQFPGPTLVCTRGKWLTIRVTNSLDDFDEPTTIHWHGIEQNLSPFFDGPQSTTQCSIVNGTSMVYRFQLFQSGTYWYHSHHSYQYVDGAWGFLVIHNSPEEVWGHMYTDEALISVNDWYHRTARDLSEDFLSNVNFPAIDSSLINGKGTYPCSNVTDGTPCIPNLQVPAIIKVVRGRTYRLRILNSSGAATYNFSIDSHKLRVIETDGVDTVLTEPVDVIQIWPAQRYSVLVTMDQIEDSFWIRTSGAGFFSRTNTEANQGRAILLYVSASSALEDLIRFKREEHFADLVQRERARRAAAPESKAVQSRPFLQPIKWNNIIGLGGVHVPSVMELSNIFLKALPSIESLQDVIEEHTVQEASEVYYPKSEPVDPGEAILLNEHDCRPFDDEIEAIAASPYYDELVKISIDICPLQTQPARICMNGISLDLPGRYTLPTIFEVIQTKFASTWSNPVYTPSLGKVIRVVINNHHVGGPHPWHLHGHTFRVLGWGETFAGDFDPERDESKLNYNGVRRDTTHNNFQSWVVFQYYTDNPGTWFFHCHLNWHLEAGLGMTFIEAAEIAQQVYKDIPDEAIKTCRNVGLDVS